MESESSGGDGDDDVDVMQVGDGMVQLPASGVGQ